VLNITGLCVKKSSDSVTVTVYPAPTAGFYVTPSPFIVNTEGGFTDTSKYNTVFWLWDFGDGNTSSSEDPEHSYSEEGIYHVKLRVENNYGCSDSAFRQIIVE